MDTQIRSGAKKFNPGIMNSAVPIAPCMVNDWEGLYSSSLNLSRKTVLYSLPSKKPFTITWVAIPSGGKIQPSKNRGAAKKLTKKLSPTRRVEILSEVIKFGAGRKLVDG